MMLDDWPTTIFLLTLVLSCHHVRGDNDTGELDCSSHKFFISSCPTYGSSIFVTTATVPLKIYTSAPAHIHAYVKYSPVMQEDDCYQLHAKQRITANATHPAVIWESKRGSKARQANPLLIAVEKDEWNTQGTPHDTDKKCVLYVWAQSEDTCYNLDHTQLCQPIPEVRSKRSIPTFFFELPDTDMEHCTRVECDCARQQHSTSECGIGEAAWVAHRTIDTLHHCVPVWSQCVALAGNQRQTASEVVTLCNLIYNVSRPVGTAANTTTQSYCLPPLVYPRTDLFWWIWLAPILSGIGFDCIVFILAIALKCSTASPLQEGAGLPTGVWAFVGAVIICLFGFIGATVAYLVKRFSPTASIVEIVGAIILHGTSWAKISSGPVAFAVWWAQHHYIVDLYIALVAGAMFIEITLAFLLLVGFGYELSTGNTFWRFLVMAAVLCITNLLTAMYYVSWWIKFRNYLYSGLPTNENAASMPHLDKGEAEMHDDDDDEESMEDFHTGTNRGQLPIGLRTTAVNGDDPPLEIEMELKDTAQSTPPPPPDEPVHDSSLPHSHPTTAITTGEDITTDTQLQQEATDVQRPSSEMTTSMPRLT